MDNYQPVINRIFKYQIHSYIRENFIISHLVDEDGRERRDGRRAGVTQAKMLASSHVSCLLQPRLGNPRSTVIPG